MESKEEEIKEMILTTGDICCCAINDSNLSLALEGLKTLSRVGDIANGLNKHIANDCLKQIERIVKHSTKDGDMTLVDRYYKYVVEEMD